ncbi:hypothetical protein CRG98_034559 [Punica granatum]|uniref:Uncharacterized protein n=1 Tax=Punica granatum TaxID=22663 RepID=A0A2I0IM10_PUNGR|nr:hypothetical protein CRG98_034559 [Punica granatum]
MAPVPWMKLVLQIGEMRSLFLGTVFQDCEERNYHAGEELKWAVVISVGHEYVACYLWPLKTQSVSLNWTAGGFLGHDHLGCYLRLDKRRPVLLKN